MVTRSWWRYQMETFSAFLAIYTGNSPVTDEFPAQRPVICVWINGWVNNCGAGELIRYRAHCDIILTQQQTCLPGGLQSWVAFTYVDIGFTFVTQMRNVMLRCCILTPRYALSTTSRDISSYDRETVKGNVNSSDATDVIFQLIWLTLLFLRRIWLLKSTGHQQAQYWHNRKGNIQGCSIAIFCFWSIEYNPRDVNSSSI